MLHHILSKHFRLWTLFGISVLLVLNAAAFAGTSGAISIPHPKTGEWCLIGLDHLGPKELSVNEIGSYLLRLENRSSCTLKRLELINRLPKRTRFIRSNPEPSDVSTRDNKVGPVVRWDDLMLRPGDSQIYQLEMRVTGGPGRELRNRFCLMMPRDAEEEYCYYFSIHVRP